MAVNRLTATIGEALTQTVALFAVARHGGGCALGGEKTQNDHRRRLTNRANALA